MKNVRRIICEALERYLQNQRCLRCDWACGVTVKELEIERSVNNLILGRAFIDAFSQYSNDYHTYEEEHFWITFRVDKETMHILEIDYFEE